jgi:7-keto-8-aminopelargonate synthetase-like enzyme/predicted N-acyltransferase
MEASDRQATVLAMHEEARRRGLFFQRCADERLTQRDMLVEGRRVVSFGSCSYLGLEFHPELIEGACDAARRFGTQFSSSRGYMSAPLYDELEENLSRIFGSPTLVTLSTTLAHQAFFTASINEHDAIVLDHQVHESVHMAATLARSLGASVYVVRHDRLGGAREVVAKAARSHRTVWYCTDGVFSMYGDFAPVGTLNELLDVAPNVRLYVDDAHGMSWLGKHGRGCHLARMPMSDRVVVATSFAKGFGAGGACLVFPTEKERERVQLLGGPLLFGGPMQPPMLGACVASSRVHLSDEIVTRQQALERLTRRLNGLLADAGLPLMAMNEGPIFFVRVGDPRVAFAAAEALLEAGIYVNVSMYPTVPMKRAGLRLAVTSIHTEEEIDRLAAALAQALPKAMANAGVTREQLDAVFADAIPDEARYSDAYSAPEQRIGSFIDRCVDVGDSTRRDTEVAGLTIRHFRTIEDVDATTWDAALGTAGSCSVAALRLTEKLFHGRERPEENWVFHYFIVTDAEERWVAATFCTEAISKDDMLMRAEVSEAVEARRATDPYLLTSRVVMMGSMMSEGNHLFLDKEANWRGAVMLLVESLNGVYNETRAAAVLLRDLSENDAALGDLLQSLGYSKMPMFDSHHLELNWAEPADWIASLSRRKRKSLGKRIERAAVYEVRSWGHGHAALDEGLDATLYALYRSVADRKRRLNVFPLPLDFVGAIANSPAWEILTLHLDPAADGPSDGAPVAWCAAHVHDGHYSPLICGLDYRYVRQHGAYRQLLYQCVLRAHALGCTFAHLGMDADFEKQRLGASLRHNCVYGIVRDHFQGTLLREIVAEVAQAQRKAVSEGVIPGSRG